MLPKLLLQAVIGVVILLSSITATTTTTTTTTATSAIVTAVKKSNPKTTTSLLPLQPPTTLNVTSTTTTRSIFGAAAGSDVLRHVEEELTAVRDDSVAKVEALPNPQTHTRIQNSETTNNASQGYIHFELNPEEDEETQKALAAKNKKTETVNEVLTSLFPNGFSDIFRFSYAAEPETTTTATTQMQQNRKQRKLTTRTKKAKAETKTPPNVTAEPQAFKAKTKTETAIQTTEEVVKPTQTPQTLLKPKVKPQEFQTKTTPKAEQKSTKHNLTLIVDTKTPKPFIGPTVQPQLKEAQNKTFFSFETSISKEYRRVLSPGHTEIVIEKVHYPRDRSSTSSEFQDGQNTITKDVLLRINRAAEAAPVLPSLLMEPTKSNATEEETLLSMNGPIVILKDSSAELEDEENDQSTEEDNLIAESQNAGQYIYQRLPDESKPYTPYGFKIKPHTEPLVNVQIVHDETLHKAQENGHSKPLFRSAADLAKEENNAPQPQVKPSHELDRFQEHAEKSFAQFSNTVQEAPSRNFLKNFNPLLSEGGTNEPIQKGNFHYEANAQTLPNGGQKPPYTNEDYSAQYVKQAAQLQYQQSLGKTSEPPRERLQSLHTHIIDSEPRATNREPINSTTPWPTHRVGATTPRQLVFVTVDTPAPPQKTAQQPVVPKKASMSPHEFVATAAAASTPKPQTSSKPSAGYTFVEVQKSINIHNKLITEKDGQLLESHETIYPQKQYHQQPAQQSLSYYATTPKPTQAPHNYVSLQANPIHVQHIEEHEQQEQASSTSSESTPQNHGPYQVSIDQQLIPPQPPPYQQETFSYESHKSTLAEESPQPEESSVDHSLAASPKPETLYEITKVVEKHIPEPYPVREIVEKIVDRPVPVEKIVERPVNVPYPVHVNRYIDRPYPVQEIIEKHIHIPYPVPEPVPVHVEHYIDRPYPVETIVEKPYPVEKIVEKIVEKHVPVEVEKIVEKPVEKIVERIVDRPVGIPIRVPVAISLSSQNAPSEHHSYLPSYPPLSPNHYPPLTPPTAPFASSHPNALPWSAPGAIRQNIPPKVLHNYYVRMIKKLLPQTLHSYKGSAAGTTSAASGSGASSSTTNIISKPAASSGLRSSGLKSSGKLPLLLKMLDIHLDLRPPPPPPSSSASWNQGSRYIYNTLPLDMTSASAASGPAQQQGDEYGGRLHQHDVADDEFERWRNGHSLKRSPDFGRNLHVEYGFKPPLVPSVEIDDQGIPLNAGIIKTDD